MLNSDDLIETNVFRVPWLLVTSTEVFNRKQFSNKRINKYIMFFGVYLFKMKMSFISLAFVNRFTATEVDIYI